MSTIGRWTMRRVQLVWAMLLGSFWFLPAMLVAAAAGLAVAMVELSAHVDAEALRRWPRVFGASASSSRGMLATIAGSMITVAGVTFSITIVAVTQVATQYTPRILRNFMRDRPSQITLGGLAGVFVYSLVVLRTIRGGDDNGFVPSIAVLVGFILAGGGIALLIYFIHHITSSLQASTIVARVARDTRAAVERGYPTDGSQPRVPRVPATTVPDPRDEHSTPESVVARRSGYVQHVDVDTLLDIARESALEIRMERGVGDFVGEEEPLATLRTSDGIARGREASPSVHRRIREAYQLGTFRLVEHDPAFGFQQLSDIAVKALSPGINDPTTAMNCLDHMGAALRHAATRYPLPACRESGSGRLIVRQPGFEDLLEVGVGQVRRHAEGKAPILGQIGVVLASLARATTEPDRLETIGSQADLLGEVVARTVAAPSDRAEIRAGLDAVRRSLRGKRPSPDERALA